MHLIIITVIGFALRFYGLSSQPLTIDDMGVAVSSVNFVERGHLGPTMWNHPHLRDILIYWALKLFGNDKMALKLISLCFGVLLIPLVYLLANRIFKNRKIALISAFLLAVDALHIDFSRLAINDIYMPFFSLIGIYMAIRYLDSSKPYLLVISAISFGFGLASKWYVAFPLVVVLVFISYQVAMRTFEPKQKIKELLFIFSALILISFTVYILTFIPWFRRGYGVPEWVTLQKSMLTGTVAIDRSQSGYLPKLMLRPDQKAYLWFVRPVHYVDSSIFRNINEAKAYISITNPFVWMLGIPAMLYLVLKGIMGKNKDLIFLFCLFIFSYLPFLIAPRPIWVNTAFAVTPFVIMAIANLANNVFKKTEIFMIYLLIVIITSIPFYLLAIGKGYEITYLRPVVELLRPSFERY